MTVVAVGMCRNEVDIAEPILRHMATQVDHIIAADNLSSDGTRELLDHLATELPITVVDDPDPAYYQNRKMTFLAHLARTEYGADWVIPHDYDEWWYSPFGTIAQVLEQAAGEFAMLTAALYDHVATSADDPAETDPILRIGWRRRDSAPLHKVAVAATDTLSIHMGNHSADYTRAFQPRILIGQLVIRHFPYRSAEQFIRKARSGAAALAATDLPESAGKHWRDLARLSDEQLHVVLGEWFHVDDPRAAADLIYDPVARL